MSEIPIDGKMLVILSFLLTFIKYIGQPLALHMTMG